MSKKVFLVLVLVLGWGRFASAQNVPAADCQFSGSFTATGRQGGPTPGSATAGFNNKVLGCTTWYVVTSNTGFSGVSVALQSAEDSSSSAGSWSNWTGVVVTGTNPITATTSAELVVTGFSPWVSLNAATLTGTGRLTYTAYGWKGRPGSVAVVTGTVSISGTVPVSVASGAIVANAFDVGALQDGAIATLGTTTAAYSCATDTTSVSVVQALKCNNQLLQTPTGQQTSANSNSVVMASDSGCLDATPATPIYPGASDNHQTVVTGAHRLCGISAFSIHSAAQFIRVYDAASGFNGCNSATGLKWSGVISGATTGAGFTGVSFGDGAAFANGVSVCITGAYGNTDTTSATASVMTVNLSYK